MCDYMRLTSISPTIIGTPEQVADELERWVEEGRVDGFNLIPIDQPGSLRDFVDLVVPVMQKRGRMRTAYPSNSVTIRELYSGEGKPTLDRSHTGLNVEIT